MWDGARWVAAVGLLGAFSTLSVVVGVAVNHEWRLTTLETEQKTLATMLGEMRAEQREMRAEQQQFYREFDRKMGGAK